MPGPIFIIGCGPMIGSHVARLFATSANFTSLALFARTDATLIAATEFITAAATKAQITAYKTDVTDSLAFAYALRNAVEKVGNPEVVVYNPARIHFTPPFGPAYADMDVVTDFSIPCLGLRTAAQVLLPAIRACADEGARHPALWVTSGAIVHDPIPILWSLCMAKSGQASLVKCIAKEEAGMGGKVHVALVTVGGQVGVEEEVNNPVMIAETFLNMWRQGKAEWGVEMKHGW
ncbi:MAG: hypothetical protein Q9170_008194 [Blastenia crenularia]